MASTGGANATRGLAKQYGLNRSKVGAGLEVLEPKEFVQFKNKIDGVDSEGNATKNLFRPLFNKSESIIKKVLGNYKTVNGDVDAIADIQKTLSFNRKNQNNKKFLDDNQLEDAFTQANNFLERYKGKVSGAFTNRFGRANAPNLTPDNIAALGEIKAAEDILDGRTALGSGVQLRGLPDSARNVRNQTNPEYFATMFDNSTRLVEVKTPTGKPGKITSNLNDAIKQITGSPLRNNTTDKAYIRVDYTNAKPVTGDEDFLFEKIAKSLNTNEINNAPIIPGTQLSLFCHFPKLKSSKRKV
ncbi:MAG: hypothetical protein AAFQ91_24475 [Cyanobacteria bacterium J06621_15]